MHSVRENCFAKVCLLGKFQTKMCVLGETKVNFDEDFLKKQTDVEMWRNECKTGRIRNREKLKSTESPIASNQLGKGHFSPSRCSLAMQNADVYSSTHNPLACLACHLSLILEYLQQNPATVRSTQFNGAYTQISLHSCQPSLAFAWDDSAWHGHQPTHLVWHQPGIKEEPERWWWRVIW